MSLPAKVLVVTLAAIIVVLMIVPLLSIIGEINYGDDSDAEIHQVNYSWKYDGTAYSIDIEISENIISGYTNTLIPRSPSLFIMPRYVTEEDPVIKNVASKLSDMTKGMTELDRASFILRFVQKNIDYVRDSDAHGKREYWQFPLETLLHRTGDCEDSSLLFLTLMRTMEYDAVLFIMPGHVAVGLSVEGATGHSVSHDGIDYYFCETTNSRGIGDSSQEVSRVLTVNSMISHYFLMLFLGVLILLIYVGIKFDRSENDAT